MRVTSSSNKNRQPPPSLIVDRTRSTPTVDRLTGVLVVVANQCFSELYGWKEVGDKGGEWWNWVIVFAVKIMGQRGPGKETGGVRLWLE
ncbi:unnamed protein product [Lactuca virosa]|uniref:Uncharacterized protein n=1 Tax=Lactuca virosa TaxID=75947 RepID=A0AAU9LIX6_9ASTR|nr:unnamed protein product [Lactuca virosa]